MSDESRRDPRIEHAREEAEGTELLETPDRDLLLEKEREEAQGVEVFEDPDRTIPAGALSEGRSGHEVLAADPLGLEDEEERDRGGAG